MSTYPSRNMQAKECTKRGGGIKVPFPMKLHCLLEEHLHDDVISWQPHGLCFLVHKRDVFVQEVMPKYFNQSKFSSFLRQLNLYGFTRRLAVGPDRGAYYHSRFVRGRGQLCSQMIRVRVKGAKAKIPIAEQGTHQAAFHVASEPNFSNMAPLPSSRGQKGIPTRTTSMYDANISIASFSSAFRPSSHNSIEVDPLFSQRAYANEKRKKELLVQIIQDEDTRAALSALLAQGDYYDEITDCKKAECEPTHPHGLECKVGRDLADVVHPFG